MVQRGARIVVTGIGVICANGIGREAFWTNVRQGKSGIRPVSTVDMTDLSTSVGGEIVGFDPEQYFNRAELRFLDRCGQLVLVAAREAAEQAQVDRYSEDPYRMGIVLGTSLGGMVSGQHFHEQWIRNGIQHAHPRLLQMYTLHHPADLVSIELGLQGPKSVICNACAAGTNAIGYATDMLISGQADVMVTGGVDPLSHLSFSGFNSLSALSPAACAPYSRSDGLNLGEGAAILILETLEHAQNRGAQVLAEVLGYALTSDSYHQTAPDPGGSGAIRSMSGALEMAHVGVEDLSYINGHGTGTPANDLIEPKAIRTFLKDKKDVPVSSTKSMLGHSLGAAGAIEAATCVLALRDNVMPPTINFDEASRKYDLDFIPNVSREAPLDVILSNSFGFGGNNASVVIGKYPHEREGHTWLPHKVVISGIGAIAAGAANTEEVFARLREGVSQVDTITEFDTSLYGCQKGGMIRKVPYAKLINPSLYRKMDTISKQGVVAARYALADSKYKIDRQNCDKVGILFATSTGPLETTEAFYRTVITQGVKNANPRLFPNTVMNAAAGHIALHFKIKGPTSTVTVGGCSIVSTLFYAYCLIKRGVSDTILVVGSDEFNEPTVAGLSRFPHYLSHDTLRPFDKDRSGTIQAAGSTAFLVQSEEAALRTGAKPYAELGGFGMTADTGHVTRLDREGRNWSQSMQAALNSGAIDAGQVGAVIAAANGIGIVDAAEAQAIQRVFGDTVPVTAPKSIFGEAMSAGVGLNILAGLQVLREGIVPRTANVREPLDDVPLNLIYKEPYQVGDVDHVLVSSYSIIGSGSYQSLLLKRYQG